MCEVCYFAYTSHRKSQCCLLNNAVQFVLTHYMHADVVSLIVSASSLSIYGTYVLHSPVQSFPGENLDFPLCTIPSESGGNIIF
jgi:hypothetical protein